MALSEITNFRGDTGGEEAASTIDQKINTLTQLVGARVRKARQMRGLSRRRLSEMSGVSQRYIAQVEAGAGNISIALLLKVGDALDCRIEWLVGEEDPWSSEILRVADLYRRADAGQRQAVLKILDPHPSGVKRARRIALIGLRGAGKSTLGRRASAHLSIPFAELNHEIEEQSGMPVADVMALYGQEGYRTLEHQALSRIVATHDTVILAVAGGIVSAPDNFALLLDSFHAIWLRATPEEHMDRVIAQGDHRPMAGNPAALQDLKTILTSREALYARAEVTLDTSGRTAEEAYRELLRVIETNRFLD